MTSNTLTRTPSPVDNATYNLLQALTSKLEAIEAYNKYAADSGAGAELFERMAGVTVSERDLRYWSVFNFFKGACANLTCRRVFRTINPAPNMALIGTALHQSYVRRVAALIEEG